MHALSHAAPSQMMRRGLEHALWVKDRLTTKPLGGEKTLLEALFGVKSNGEMVRVLQCTVQYYVHYELRGRLDMKARKGMHICMSHEIKREVIDVGMEKPRGMPCLMRECDGRSGRTRKRRDVGTFFFAD